MSEEEKEILHYLEGAIDTYIEGIKVTKVEMSVKDDEILLNYIDKLQKELEEKTTILMTGANKVKQLEKENKEKDKVIDLMAEQLTDVAVWDLPLDEIHYWNSKDEAIDYFYKKAEE